MRKHLLLCTCFSLYLPNFCLRLCTAILSCGIFHLMHLPDSHCTSPAAFILLWRVVSLYKWKPVTILVLKTAWSSVCSNSFPWPQPSFWGEHCQPTRAPCSSMPKKAAYLAKHICFTWKRAAGVGLLRATGEIPRLLVAGAAQGCQGALLKWWTDLACCSFS